MRPEDVAVVGANRAFTYGELDEYATRIASWLRKRGARPNSLVAVVMEKGWEQVAAVLGILRSVPLIFRSMLPCPQSGCATYLTTVTSRWY